MEGAPRRPLDQLRWLAETLEQAQAAHESVWLLMHVPPGINSYNSAVSVKQGGPPETFWQQELTARFLQLADRHAATMQVGFVGHTHMDDFRVVRKDGSPSLLLKIAPAVSPIFGNNPGYQVHQYDRESGALFNYQTYNLTNLPGQRAGCRRGGRRRHRRPRLPPRVNGPSSMTSVRLMVLEP